MAGRGKGRGRGGRGAIMEQLGLQKGDVVPEQFEVPPETYPPLQFHPVQVSTKEDLVKSYLLVVKKELREYFQNSEYHIALDSIKPDIERYSDRFQVLTNKSKLSLQWSRFPKELHPKATGRNNLKRKRSSPTRQPKTKRLKWKDVDVKEALEELEKKEISSTKEDEEQEKEEGQAEAVEDLEEEEVDEEMDEGTDYINSYFDNGENYEDDEDDALEEGVM